MTAKNIMNPVVSQSIYKNNTFLKSANVNYQDWGNNIIAPVSLEQKTGTNTSQVVQKYNSFDVKGNVLESQKDNDVKKVVLWGYNKMYPVAEIIGTDYATVAAIVNQSVLDNPSSETALKTELNNIRTSLSSAMVLVTTYTYKPLIGITSKTDPTGLTTFYEYDGLGRLLLIRDQNSNILKKYCYNYFGQREDCGVNTSPIWTSTGQMRCQPCPANAAYTSGVRQHEEKDTNPYSPTYNQTKWVDDGRLCAVAADWQVQSTICEVVGGVNTGNQIIIKKDVNPCSNTYNQTTQVTQVNCLSCPKPDNWVATGSYRCVTNANGNTGYQERQEANQQTCSLTYGSMRWVANGYNTTSCPMPSSCTYSNCQALGPQYNCINGRCEQGYKVYTGFMVAITFIIMSGVMAPGHKVILKVQEGATLL